MSEIKLAEKELSETDKDRIIANLEEAIESVKKNDYHQMVLVMQNKKKHRYEIMVEGCHLNSDTLGLYMLGLTEAQHHLLKTGHTVNADE